VYLDPRLQARPRPPRGLRRLAAVIAASCFSARYLPFHLAFLAVMFLAGTAHSVRAGDGWRFTDVTEAAGLVYEHGYSQLLGPISWNVAGGVASGDYDNDGWIDLYVERGDIGPNLLFRNRGDGTFEEVGVAAGVGVDGFLGSGPLFFDFDGDGWLDLFLGAIEQSDPLLFRNRGDGTFEDVTARSGMDLTINTVSATAGDYDGDGLPDLFLSHWLTPRTDNHLWRNLGDGRFRCVDLEAGLSDPGGELTDYGFATNLADINRDGFVDLLLTSDFGTSQVWLNDGTGRFDNITTDEISDENGMGAAVGDYDNDGDLDWFVTSVWDGDGVTEGDWGTTGNRLYRNAGSGVFENVTDEAGVREGHWGWAASFADLNNDGTLDIVHVNGWPKGSKQFHDDPSRLFVSNGDGSFTERSGELGFDDTGQGRGLVCFDFDHDGDIDIFVANSRQPPRLWRNDGGNAMNYLAVSLEWRPPNHAGIGSRIEVVANGAYQMREVRCGSNYVSQNPAAAHFGLGETHVVDVVRVTWPNGSTTAITGVRVNQRLVLSPRADAGPPAAPAIVSVHPNPFAAEARIRVRIHDTAPVTAHIFDVSGRGVRALERSGGDDSGVFFRWDGRDDGGRAVAAGVYFLRVVTPLGTDSARITLVR